MFPYNTLGIIGQFVNANIPQGIAAISVCLWDIFINHSTADQSINQSIYIALKF